MHYCRRYCDCEEDSFYLSKAINNGLGVVNHSDVSNFYLSPLPSPPSSYDDNLWFIDAANKDAMCTCHKCMDLCYSSPPFKDDDLDTILQGVLELEEDLYMQDNIPSPTVSQPIPTIVNDVDSDWFRSGSATPSPPLPAAEAKDCQTVGKVRRRRQRQRQLWQFLLEILSDDKYSPSIIEWVRRDDGVFRFVKPRSVAELWGKRRRRANMTYEHLARAMRYYYKRGVMKRAVDLGRLVYQFQSNAEGWREYTRVTQRG